MTLGVLNNLSAIYAEQNLNNTSSSLQTVLEQLSSGSKINSGADDAAGLSLVNGLAANSAALTQSETNATEGVGLLDVADGALSQVTSLLDRAITLATEASNGTLNSTQESAANQEYQSIMAEITNIGSTTTYNQEQVFSGTTVAIYSGDSSTVGSSIDDLKIRTLSSSSVGDSDGAMSYSSGQSNVFMDLSNDGHNAAITDSLNASGATTVNVSYITKGVSGAAQTASAAISVGSGTSYANTAQGLINAINGSGLGLTATFGTAAEAGSVAATTASTANNGGGTANDTGIEISAEGIGTGTNGAGVVGAISLPSDQILSGTLTVVGSDGDNHNIILGEPSSTDTLANLESTINAGGWGLTAALNQAGTQLTFTTADPKVTVSASNLTESTAPTSTSDTVVASDLGSLTVGSSSDTLTGTLNIQEGTDGTNAATTLTLGGAGTSTLAQLATTITDNAAYGITATVNASEENGHAAGTVLTFTKAGGDLGTAAISGTSITDIASPGVVQSSTLGSLAVASAGDTLGVGSLTILSGITGGSSALTLGSAAAGTDTLTNLAATINKGGYGITATLDPTGTDLTFTQTSGSFSAGINGGGIDDTYTPTTPIAIAAGTTLGSITVANAGDTISVGTATDGIVLTGLITTTVDIGTAPKTLAQVLTTVNGLTATTGIIATLNATAVDGHAAGTIMTFTNELGDSGTVAITGGQTLSDNIAAVATTTGVFGIGDTLGSLSVNGTSDTLTGTLDVVGANAVASTITLGISNSTDTLANLMNYINGDTSLGITAALNPSAVANPNGTTVPANTLLTFTATANDAHAPSITQNGVIADTTAASMNSNVTVTGPGGGNIGTLTAANGTDLLSGTLEVTNTTGTTTPYLYTGQTLQEIADSFSTPPGGTQTPDGSGITATLSGSKITFTGTGLNAVSGINFNDVTPASTTNEEVTPGTVLNTMTVAKSGDLVTGSFNIVEGADSAHTNEGTVALTSGQTLAEIADDFNGVNWGGGYQDFNTYGITASLNAADTVLTFTQTPGDASIANVTDHSSTLTDTVAATTPTITMGASSTLANTLTVNALSDTLTGTLSIQEGADGKNTQSTFNLAGQTVAEIQADFTTGAEANLGITATLNAAVDGGNAIGTVLTFTATPGNLGTASVVDATAIDDRGMPPSGSPISVSGGTMLDTLTVNDSSDSLGGTLNVTSGEDGVTRTIHLGTLNTNSTLAELAATINNPSNDYGVTATLNSAGTELTFTKINGATLASSVVGTSVTDSQSASIATSVNLGTLNVNSSSDTLAGTLTGLEGNGTTPYTINLGVAGKTDTLQDLANTINVTDASYGITAMVDQAGTSLVFAATGGVGAPTIDNEGTLTDTTPSVVTPISLKQTPSSGTTTPSTLGSLTGLLSTDTLSGSLTIGSNTLAIGTTDNTGATLAAAINNGDFGASATYNATSDTLTFTSLNSSLTVNTTNLNATVLNGSVATAVGPLAGGITTASPYYSIGISGSVTDTSTAVTANNTTTYGGTGNVGIATDTNGAGGIATMSYADASGQSLSGTDLLNQSDAQTALTELNVAVNDAASMDGYIGAQINTLNSLSQVMSTQQENIVSAQNAIQATDYAAATSNMSKYEILSQTGIAALAQANTVQQEVTKLLQ